MICKHLTQHLSRDHISILGSTIVHAISQTGHSSIVVAFVSLAYATMKNIKMTNSYTSHVFVYIEYINDKNILQNFVYALFKVLRVRKLACPSSDV
jgi:hypothetical protein